jgi:hypothetical protein
MNKKILVLLSMISGASFATTFQPNTSNFSCPDGEIINTAKKIDVSVGEQPGGIGRCFWRDPVVSFAVSEDRTSVTGYTTWTLDGGWLADGCSDIKGEKLTSIGVIAKVQCKAQQI